MRTGRWSVTMDVDVGAVEIQEFTIHNISPLLYVFVVSWLILVISVVVYVYAYVSRTVRRKPQRALLSNVS